MQNPFRHQLRFDSSEAWIGALFFINEATGKIVEKGEVTASLPTVNLARRSAGKDAAEHSVLSAGSDALAHLRNALSPDATRFVGDKSPVRGGRPESRPHE